jgi:hypothetical protein
MYSHCRLFWPSERSPLLTFISSGLQQVVLPLL